MRPSSSISSSRYLLALIAGTLFLLCVCAAFVAAARTLGRESYAYEALLAFQFNKLQRIVGPVETVFVGDSSLGNAIDAAEWSRLSGHRALNLALTAGYGLRGSLHMIQRSVQAARPKNVVIMQSPAIFGIGPGIEGLPETVEPGPIAAIHRFWQVTMSRQNIGQSIGWLRRWLLWHLRLGLPPQFQAQNIDGDYVRQTDRRLVVKGTVLDSSRIVGSSEAALRDIHDLCRAEHLNCIFAYGPVVQPICDESRQYLQKSEEIVAASRIANGTRNPICIPLEDMGDSWDHVAPTKKAEYTGKYFELLRPMLLPRS